MSAFTCPVCLARDIDWAHVARCKAKAASRSLTVKHAATYGIPAVTVLDLWAHVHSQTGDPAETRHIVAAVCDLGWRPCVGSDPKRLWQRGDDDG